MHTTTHYPFLEETHTLFRCVSEHDFDTLADLCDDDFGIVDLNEEGKNVVVDDRAGWENWFRTLFARLKAMNARTDTTIQDYQALQDGNLGYGVVKFRQHLYVGEHTFNFDCVATIIWKRVGDRWKESRWHCSLIKSDLPGAG
ncbi:MAG: nuclear transport factor 2 family protein [Catalinimonas sp.]